MLNQQNLNHDGIYSCTGIYFFKSAINFDGGDLSSDAGLLLIKEFISKLGIDTLLEKAFKTNDPALFQYHSDPKKLLQMIYMIIAGYFEDDASDELTNDPVFKSVLEKDVLASQPTVSRFFNRMDEDTLNQFLAIARVLRRKIYSIPDAAGCYSGSGFHSS